MKKSPGDSKGFCCPSCLKVNGTEREGLSWLLPWVLLAQGCSSGLAPFLTEFDVSAATADDASGTYYAGCIKTLLCRHRVRAWLSSERIFSERRGRDISEMSWQAELR